MRLIIAILPVISEVRQFALKGGTLINLFIRELPRLSVDIDLVYLPVETREESLKGIDEGLRIIASKIKTHLGLKVNNHIPNNSPYVAKLEASSVKAVIKIEPNLTLRGCVYPCREYDLVKTAQERFQSFATVQGLSVADTYGGKICAALDRQHPRDLFDIKILLENEGLLENIRKAFIVYLICHNRPMDELLQPHLLDISATFSSQFEGMTTEVVSCEELVIARGAIVQAINSELTNSEKRFILSVAQGQPEWNLIDLDQIRELPAVKWKLLNIKKMDPLKRAMATDKLNHIFGW